MCREATYLLIVDEAISHSESKRIVPFGVFIPSWVLTQLSRLMLFIRWEGERCLSQRNRISLRREKETIWPGKRAFLRKGHKVLSNELRCLTSRKYHTNHSRLFFVIRYLFELDISPPWSIIGMSTMSDPMWSKLPPRVCRNKRDLWGFVANGGFDPTSSLYAFQEPIRQPDSPLSVSISNVRT